MFTVDTRTFTAFELEYKVDSDGFFKSKTVAALSKTAVLSFSIIRRFDDGLFGVDKVVHRIYFSANLMTNVSLARRIYLLAEGLVIDRDAAEIISDAFISLIVNRECIEGYADGQLEIWLKEFPHLTFTIKHMQDWL